MTTQKLDPHYHATLWSPSAEALLIGALLILSATIYVPPKFDAIMNSASVAVPTMDVHASMPFGVPDVTGYFAREIGTTPAQFGETTIFPQAATLNDTNDYEVAVTAEENAGVSVEFRGTGAGALTLARGFLGSSLFRPAETAELVSMLDRRNEAPSAHLPRFNVQMQLSELIDMDRLTIQFRPPAN